jgi:UDP-glucuronate decarboxylase
VTGGSGFLGSHLCERLLVQGAEVICLDNFFTGARRNIEHLLDHKRFDLIRHDVTFPIYLELDQIYNLACPASPIHYQIRCRRQKPVCMAPLTCLAWQKE